MAELALMVVDDGWVLCFLRQVVLEKSRITILSVGVAENEISLILIFCNLADATSM